MSNVGQVVAMYAGYLGILKNQGGQAVLGPTGWALGVGGLAAGHFLRRPLLALAGGAALAIGAYLYVKQPATSAAASPRVVGS